MKFTFGNLPALGWNEDVERIVDLARLCDDLGIDRFGIADYRFYHDCFAVMTACLQATERLEVESLVTDPYVRHPSLTAAAIATMDDLAPGRVILGLGGGLEQPAYWGEERPHPVDAVRECVDLCRRLWRGEEVTHQGRVIQTVGAKLNFTPKTDIKILLAARGKRMLRLAGEVADVVHLAAWFLNLAYFQENIGEVRRGAERAGRDLSGMEIDFSVPACISRDRSAARRAAKRFAARGILWMAGAEKYSKDRKDWSPPTQLSVSGDLVHALATEWDTWRDPDLPDELAARIDDELIDQFAVAGEPDECADRLVELIRDRPESTGVRIQAYPPAGMGSFDGYYETALGVGAAIARLRAPSGQTTP
jgi:5,10-methylenetetrahydromethanopterin reductase